MPSILLPWVERLGLRHQGVIVSAMRGCDLAPRHDPSKIFQRILRGAVLLPHAGRFANPATYINIVDDEQEWWTKVTPFLQSWDHYPNHYVIHSIHAAEIIGYCGPPRERPVYADRWEEFYLKACHMLHLNPESSVQMDARLNADEEKFASAQDARFNRRSANE